MNHNIIVLDTETTGVDPESSSLLEIATAILVWSSGKVSMERHWESLVRYDGKIPPEAKAVHHIQEWDVAEGSGALTRNEVLQHIGGLVESYRPGGPVLFAAHNAKFDASFLPELDRKSWICTYKCAYHLWPDAPNHKNQTLRYYLGLRIPKLDTLGVVSYPHRALYDTLVTRALLEEILKNLTPEQALNISQNPLILKYVTFGKHRGAEWRSLPRSYMQWCLTQDMDENIHATCRRWLYGGE